ncbi:hypothetical protein MLD38_007261 [Melastoma candidum]|uniref:Uncharacterized protein n=1 Tax=Melastoma candidum TaxID=119954 RepID=A0ACB9RR36_9MYRT|nr:hypothetical protein MLD38_007261 [Melastoma candidum]
MHRCALVGGSCSCCPDGSMFHDSCQSPSSNTPSFSFLFSSPGCHPNQPIPSFDDPFDLYHRHGDLFSSPVDCTLSLGTPSTRSSSGYENERRSSTAAGSHVPNFCWDSFQPPKQYSSFTTPNKNGNSASGGINGCGSGNDSLIVRRCTNCDTTSTPLWRNGPRGPKSLCNACGIRFKKEEKRAAATTAGSGAGGHPPPSMAPNAFRSHSSWVHAQAASQSHILTASCFAPAVTRREFQFANDDGGAGQDSELSFLSWRLNVADCPGLVPNFTG